MSIVLVLRPRCFAASKLLVCKRVVMPENKTMISCHWLGRSGTGR